MLPERKLIEGFNDRYYVYTDGSILTITRKIL